jgi:hypothetical protein
VRNDITSSMGAMGPNARGLSQVRMQCLRSRRTASAGFRRQSLSAAGAGYARLQNKVLPMM